MLVFANPGNVRWATCVKLVQGAIIYNYWVNIRLYT